MEFLTQTHIKDKITEIQTFILNKKLLTDKNIEKLSTKELGIFQKYGNLWKLIALKSILTKLSKTR